MDKRSARHRRTEESRSTLLGGRRALLSAALTVVLVLTAGPAFAFWSSTGFGFGSAKVNTLVAPTNAAGTVSGSTAVSVSWTASAGSVTPSGYYVIRTQSGSSVAACGSNASALISSTTCSDTPGASGSYTYSVSAVFHTWTATSAASPAVAFTATSSVVAPTIAITNGSSYTSETPTPVISGTTSAASGNTVTIAVGSQTITTTVQPGGTWSGSATTLANGTYVVTARVTNSAGSASATQNLTIAPTPAMLALKTAGTYSVLAGGLITSTGNSVLNGDIGTSPAGSLAGFPPATYSGSVHINDSVSAAAAADFTSAMTDATGRPVDAQIAGDLNGRTLHAGVYHSAAAIALTGTLTLDAQGDPNAVFIIVGDAAVNTAAASSIVLANGARASRVFWVAGGAVGVGANATFAGIILAKGAITIGAQSPVDGRALTQAAVTLSTNTLSTPE